MSDQDSATLQRTKNAAHPERGSLLPEKMHWLSLTVFLGLAFGLSWLLQLPVWLSGEGLDSPVAISFSILMMFTPAAAALVVVFLINRPSNIPRFLGMAPLRPAVRTIVFTLLAGTVFTLIPIAAILLGGLAGWLQLDLDGFSYYTEVINQQGLDLADIPLEVETLVLLVFLTLPLSTLINAFAAFGEELGWRGWLVPALRPLGTWPALVFSGMIWGLWHAPLVLLGFNYQRTDVLGVVFMTVFSILPGILLGWLRLRTASIWPAVIAHGALNASANTALLLTAGGQNPENLVWGSLLGWPGLIIMGALALLLLLSGAWRSQAQAGLYLAETQQIKPGWFNRGARQPTLPQPETTNAQDRP